MMHVRDAQPSAVKESVEPLLRLQLTVIASEPGSTVGLRVQLYAADGVRLGEETEAVYGWNPATFSVAKPTAPFHQQEWNLRADVRLTRRELDHIERCREKNPKRDVIFQLTGRATRFVAAYSTTRTQYVEYQVPGINPRQTHTLIAFHPPNKTDPAGGPEILSAEPNSGMFQVIIEEVPKFQRAIPSSDWATEFAPVFGIGKFLVLEVPESEIEVTKSGELAERVKEAGESLQRMRIDIQKGEWTQCAEDARAVVELLKKKELIRPLLETNGIQPGTAEALLTGLEGILDYTHAFHHRVDKAGQKPVPAVNAESEDAYLGFATAAALLNLVARKLQKSQATP